MKQDSSIVQWLALFEGERSDLLACTGSAIMRFLSFELRPILVSTIPLAPAGTFSTIALYVRSTCRHTTATYLCVGMGTSAR